MIRKSVQFALLLYDSFTGNCIFKGGHEFLVNGRQFTPIHKSEGFYVFSGLDGEEFDVIISGSKYLTEKITVKISELLDRTRAIKLRLTRISTAPFGDCEYIKGVHSPGKMVYAKKHEENGIKLVSAKEYDENSMIVVLSGYFLNPILQTRFMIEAGNKWETFITDESFPDKSYLVKQIFANKYKMGAPITRLYEARCDENGEYAIAVETGQQSLINEILFYDEEEEKWGSACITQLN